jgi:hypothetical protein
MLPVLDFNATYCLPNVRLPKSPNHYIFALKMATQVFVETWLNPESRSFTLNSSRENLRDKSFEDIL